MKGLIPLFLEPRNGGLQSAAFINEFARDFACQCGFAKCITAAGTADRRCFAITRTNGEHYSRRKQPCRTECADSRRAVADPDSRSAANVFCRVAPRASLCAAQYQS